MRTLAHSISRGITLAAWLLVVYCSAFQFQQSKSHRVLRRIDFQRDIRSHDGLPRKPRLLFATPKDASVIVSNKSYLIERLGFAVDKIEEIYVTTNILTLDIGVLDDRVDWIRKRLKLNEREIKKITQSQPQILGRTSLTNLAPKLDYLQNRLLLDDNSLRKLILSAPHILPLSIEHNIAIKLDWLQQRLDLDDSAVSKMISRQPYTLGCSIDENLEPTLDWLQHALDLDDSAVSKMIRQYPQLMHLSVESNLEPKLEWLRIRLDLDDAAVGKMIERSPAILGLSIDDNLEPKLEWIQERLSLTDDGLSKFIKKFPSIFSCNVKTNLQPTLAFYIDALGKREALTLVKQNPSLLGYSLENRLKPRLEEIRDVGLLIDAACLRRIGQSSENLWYASLISSLWHVNEDNYVNDRGNLALSTPMLNE